MSSPSGNPPNPLVAYTPSAQAIASITAANPAVITTVNPHGYLPGIFVFLFIPYVSPYAPLSSKIFPATILSPTTFSIPADTSLLPAFVLSSTQTPQVCPAGEFATTLANAADVILL